MSKAQVVRTLIANCKANSDVPTEELIAAIRAECGFARQLARAYIKANWPKVQVVATPALTLEEAMARVPMREKGRFIAKAVREEMARKLMETA